MEPKQSTFDGRLNGYLPGPRLNIDPSLALHRDADPEVDPVTYEVVRSNLWNINLEHGEAIKRTSGSPVVIWTDDFNQSIQTEDGDPVCFGPSIQWFGGMADLVVKWTLENRSANPGIRDGDIFLQNDPYVGCSHQMDTSLFAPVFWEGKLFAWVYNCCHESDVGGVEPGSFVPQAKDIFWESQPVPPIKIAEGGHLRRDVEEMFVRKSRMAEMASLEIRSQVAGINVAKARLLALVRRYGPATVKGVMRGMISGTAQAIRARLRQIPDGTWQDVMYFSGGLPGDRKLHKIVMTVTKKDDTLAFSNKGTDLQFGPTNCTAGAWRGGILTGLMPILAFDQSFASGGVLQCLRFEPEPGVATSCTFPAAVTNVQAISTAVHQTVQVMGKMMVTHPELRQHIVSIGGPHTLIAFLLSGQGRRGNDYYYGFASSTMAGNVGAFSFRDGVSTGGTYISPRTRTPDVEIFEQAGPVLFLYRKEVQGGGGHGKWRGGAGVEEAFTTDLDRTLYAHTFGVASAAPAGHGRFGGYLGPSGGIFHHRATEIAQQLSSGQVPSTNEQVQAIGRDARLLDPMEVGIVLRPGDILRCSTTCGGAGYGDPILRDPALVAQDVAEGVLRPEQAERIYGVVLAPPGSQADAVKTRAQRLEMRATRITRAGGKPGTGHLAQPRGPDRSGVLTLGESLGMGMHGLPPDYLCLECGRILGTADANYKLGCLRYEEQLKDIDPAIFHDTKLQIDEALVYRHYLCPGCGVFFEHELCRPTDEPLWDVRIDWRALRKA